MDQQMDLSRGWRDPLFKDRIPKQRVDEGALAGIELAHHHEQEKLVELPHGRSERRLVRRGRAEFGQRIPDRGQQFACLCQLTVERRFKNTKHVNRNAKLTPTPFDAQLSRYEYFRKEAGPVKPYVRAGAKKSAAVRY